MSSQHCAVCGKRGKRLYHYHSTVKSEPTGNFITGPHGVGQVAEYKVTEVPYRGNLQVVRQNSIGTLTLWDGESYRLHYDPFCTLTCARAFADAAYRAGYRINTGD